MDEVYELVKKAHRASRRNAFVEAECLLTQAMIIMELDKKRK